MFDPASFDRESFDPTSFAFGVDIAVVIVEQAAAAAAADVSTYGTASAVESVSLSVSSVDVIVAVRSMAEILEPLDIMAGVADGGAEAIAVLSVFETQTGSATNVRATVESGSASDHTLSVTILLAARSENLSPADSSVAVLDDTAMMIEIVSLAQTAIQSVLAQADVIELASAGDLSQLAADVDAAITEAIASSDQSITARTLTWLVPTSDRIARLKPVATIANVVKQRWM